MSLASKLKNTQRNAMQVIARPGEIYLAAGSPVTLFTITGGPLWVIGLFAHVTVLGETSGFTGAIAISGVQAQNAAVVLNSTLNDIIMWPLEATAGSVIIPNFAATPMPTIGAGTNAFAAGQIAQAGNIVLTHNGTLTSTLVFYVVFKRLHPDSDIVIA